MNYPDILTALSGNEVTDKETWEKYRRDEILTLFTNFVYGAAPIKKPEDIAFRVSEIKRENNILQKKVTISFCGYEISADVFVPQNNTKKLPAYLIIMHQYAENNFLIDESLDWEAVPILDIIKRGYALVAMKTSRISEDFFRGEKYKQGIFNILDKNRRDNSWSIISAWAWGAMRVMDYLETDSDIDSKKVAVIGHSRSGKTALWTAAQDRRFAMAVSNNSGCTGAAFTRGKKGEHVKDINDATNWFCENYKKYNENEDMLPVDQHMLLALIAPRPLYVSSSSNDEWADPESELFSCKLAGDAYSLYGKKGVVITDDTVKLDTAYHEGTIGYHNKTGEHSLTKFDWNMFMDFSDKYMI